jgi:DNA-binding transcriptional regulator YiaG
MPAGDPVLEVQPLPQANIISEVLAGHRTALRTQQEAARQIGVAPATFARWERVSASPQGTF